MNFIKIHLKFRQRFELVDVDILTYLRTLKNCNYVIWFYDLKMLEFLKT